MKQSITIPELCKALNLPETSTRRVIRAFPHFFPVAVEGRPLRYKAEALDVMRFILAAQKAGTSPGEIEVGLAGRGFSRELSGTANHQPPTANQAPLPEISGKNLAEWLAVQEVRQQEALEVNRRLLAALERQNELMAQLVATKSLEDHRPQGQGFWAWLHGWWKAPGA